MNLYRIDYTTTDEIRPMQHREITAGSDESALKIAQDFVDNTTMPKIHPYYVVIRIGEIIKQ